MIIKICLIYLFLIQMAFPQVGGGAAIQEAGTQNFSVQTIDPTTVPVANKKYLFNTNSQFKTKDQFGNIQRLVQDQNNLLSIGNGDVEEGLTGFAGIGTLNTTTPLQGLKSLNLDTTALNDFAETALVTIPPILMGQLCMAKVAIRGGDTNLQLQVVNGAGTVVGFKQMIVNPDAPSQFITFQCPTQALITATPALGQLKIKLVQSTATNAALATLDNFYLGQFESNQMVVSGQVEEFRAYLSAGVYAPGATLQYTSNVNSLNECLSYATGVFTAKARCQISLNCGAVMGGAYGNQVLVDIIVNGANAGQQGTASNTASIRGSYVNAWSGTLNAGNTIYCRNAPASTVSSDFTTASLTATPLPQLAQVVSSAPNDLSARITNTAVVTSENDTSFLNGNCTLNSAGDFTCPFGLYLEKIPACSIQIEDNTNTAKEWNVYAISATSVSYRLFSDTNVLTSYAHNLKCSKQGDSYSQSLFAVLPAQLQATNQLKNIVGSAEILNPAGTATIGTPNLSAGFLNTVSRTALGIVRNTFNPLYFQGEYACSALPLTAFQVQYTKGAGFIDIKTFNAAGTAVDSSYFLKCIGI